MNADSKTDLITLIKTHKRPIVATGIAVALAIGALRVGSQAGHERYEAVQQARQEITQRLNNDPQNARKAIVGQRDDQFCVKVFVPEVKTYCTSMGNLTPQ